MSNYPPGMTTGYMGTHEWTVRCPHDGACWNVVMYGELGGWGPIAAHEDTRGVCPKCGSDDWEQVAYDPTFISPEWEAEIEAQARWDASDAEMDKS